MAIPTQLSDLSATAASNSPAGGDTVGTTMDDYLRAIQSIIARISAGTDALATPALGAATGTSLVLSGLATVNGAFTSLGLDDNATAKALTLSGSGANSVTIANSATNPTIDSSGTSELLINKSLLVDNVASAVNYIQISGTTATSSNAFVLARGADTDVALILSGQGGSGITLATVNGTIPQVSITHTASADRYITLTGSNSGNPTIGTSAGALFTSSATGSVNIGGTAAKPACTIGGTGLDNRLIIEDSATNPKIYTSAGNIDLGADVVFTGQTVGTTVGAAGGASALPATPLGYLTTSINGTPCKIPYYVA